MKCRQPLGWKSGHLGLPLTLSQLSCWTDKDGYTWSPPPTSTEPSVTAGVLKEPQMIQGSTLETTEEESGVNRGAQDPHSYCNKAAPLPPVIWNTE